MNKNIKMHYPEFLAVQEAADILHTTPETMSLLIAGGQVAHIEPDGHIVVPTVLLEDYVEKARATCCNNSAIEKGLPPSEEASQHLDSCTSSDMVPSEGDTTMARNFNQYVTINCTALDKRQRRPGIR